MASSMPASQVTQQAQTLRQNFSRVLFADPKIKAYAVLDGASNPGLLDHLYSERPEFICLYPGELEPDVAQCAPYLVRLDQDTPFANWLLGRFWGNHWGIFALSRVDFRELRQHFRKFNRVYEPESMKPLLFRYYDPRVLSQFLPTCDYQQTAEFFGPVEVFFAETEDGAGYLRFDRSPVNPK